MSASAGIDLGSVQKTLLLPLWGRAVESRKARPLLVDPIAVRAVHTMHYDFSTIAGNIHPVTRAAWIARSLHADAALGAFLREHPSATVVNLGCGLDTTFARADNGKVTWYDLDLPDVIELRRHYIPESPRAQCISCSLFSNDWLAKVRDTDALFILCMGVLYYFEESLVRGFLTTLANEFPGCEMLFDVCSPRGMRVANRKVIEASGMDQNAMLHWGIEHPKTLEEWDPRITVLHEYPLFRGLRCAFGARMTAGLFISDALRIMSMVHLRFASERG